MPVARYAVPASQQRGASDEPVRGIARHGDGARKPSVYLGFEASEEVDSMEA